MSKACVRLEYLIPCQCKTFNAFRYLPLVAWHGGCTRKIQVRYLWARELYTFANSKRNSDSSEKEICQMLFFGVRGNMDIQKERERGTWIVFKNVVMEKND